MMGLSVKARENGAGSPRATVPVSPRADVGEIDTQAPFQSVKAAVTLFGEAVSPKAATTLAKKSKAEERVLEKETQHTLMLRERGYYTNQLRSAEAAKAQALLELQRAKRTLQQLTNKLDALTASKQASINATDDAKIRVKELEEERARRAQLGDDAWKLEVNSEREYYKATTVQLVANKVELTNLRQDFDAALVAKLAVFQKAEEAQQKAQMNQERQSQLLKEVDELHGALEKVKLASLHAQEEYSKLMAEKENSLLAHKVAKEEAEREIERLKEEYVPTETLQEKLEETLEASRVLQEQLNEIQSSQSYIVRKLAPELDSAKKALEEAVAEENLLLSAVESFKQQLEEGKRMRLESEKKASEAESTVEQMQADLEKSRAELETAMSGQSYVMLSSREKLLAEAEKARHEAEDSKNSAKLLKKEAEAARIAIKEAERKLKHALKEVEAAEAAEKLTEERVYNYSADLHGSGSIPKIRLSVEEFDAMNKKIEESRNEADMKVATAIAQVEAINAREKGVSEKLEAILKESNAIQSEIEDALKRAENAEAARKIVESELQKWRQNERREAGKHSKRRILISY